METSKDPEKIKYWASVCLVRELFIKGRIAQKIFLQPEKIQIMCFDKNSWAMCHTLNYWNKTKLSLSVYVHPNQRGKGLGAMLIASLDLKDKVVVSYAHKNYYSKIPNLEFEI